MLSNHNEQTIIDNDVLQMIIIIANGNYKQQMPRKTSANENYYCETKIIIILTNMNY